MAQLAAPVAASWDLTDMTESPSDPVTGRPQTPAGSTTETSHSIRAWAPGRSSVPPVGLSFAASSPLFPGESLCQQLVSEYETQCERIFSGGGHPPFADVLARFEEIRSLP